MTGPAPRTRNWTALENKHKPKGLHLLVYGEVEVTNSNKQPRLRESPERNPKHLGLHLTIEDVGKPGLDVKCWKPASFHKEVTADQYDSVTIRWDVSAIAEVPVVNDREHHAKLAAQVAEVNAKHAKAPKKAAPKSPTPKQAGAKKAAPKQAKKAPSKQARKKAAPKKAVTARAVRAVGGWARGVKKALTSVMTSTKKKPVKKVGKRKGKKRR
jgi:hypothetical protein